MDMEALDKIILEAEGEEAGPTPPPAGEDRPTTERVSRKRTRDLEGDYIKALQELILLESKKSKKAKTEQLSETTTMDALNGG